ncbi:hypothetical protein JK358_20415 [Nocardia sp. 2]|uniref:Uncharacterized protein n=1 Tax=Nocardia acididurans TaxID=2802282 RepID=A0ABS1M9F2_9NOCA|nr:hypothetical protein [Nocardia acididurans]MBL1076765.1 hypothetical protein [Nocardia acididurans]
MSMQTAGSAVRPGDDGYDRFLAGVGRAFEETVAEGAELFTVDTEGLFDVFLAGLGPELAAENACGTCRSFMRRYGGLVVVDADGTTRSAVWRGARVPAEYAAAVGALAEHVERGPITSVFRSKETAWGRAEGGSWTHLALVPPAGLVHQPSALVTTYQYVAGKNADRGTLARGLAEYSHDIVKKAVALLRTEQLYRSDAILGAGTWLLDVHERLDKVRGRGEAAQRRRDAIVWQAAATAPAGFAHVKSGMIGTLLADLADGLPYPVVKQRFSEKMHPLQYRRPTAAPTAAMIARAEKVIAELRAAGALERRFATLADVVPLWRPRPQPDRPRGDGVFGHLRPAEKRATATDLDAEPVVMTWEKFERTVLPDAERIEFEVPSGTTSFGAMVTAVHPGAPPIIQWDSRDQRNPVTWYLYVNGSPAERWGLKPGEYREVTAVVGHPATWRAGADRTGRARGAMLALAGATDTQYTRSAGFFPEDLKSELHEIRKTLEAYTRDAVVAGKDDAEVCGLLLFPGGTLGHTVRVSSDGVRVRYVLDRWD